MLDPVKDLSAAVLENILQDEVTKAEDGKSIVAMRLRFSCSRSYSRRLTSTTGASSGVASATRSSARQPMANRSTGSARRGRVTATAGQS